MLMYSAVGVNAASAEKRGVIDMVQPKSAKLVASIRLWSIRNYLHDLAQFYAGDEGRFTRMVVDGGKSLPSAHPGGWVQHITNMLPTVIDFYPGEVNGIIDQLQAWGHTIDCKQT